MSSMAFFICINFNSLSSIHCLLLIVIYALYSTHYILNCMPSIILFCNIPSYYVDFLCIYKCLCILSICIWYIVLYALYTVHRILWIELKGALYSTSFYWCSLVEAKGPLISVKTSCCCHLVVLSPTITLLALRNTIA